MKYFGWLCQGCMLAGWLIMYVTLVRFATWVWSQPLPGWWSLMKGAWVFTP